MYQVFQVNNAYGLTAGNDIKAGDVVFVNPNGEGVKADQSFPSTYICAGIAVGDASKGSKVDIARQGQIFIGEVFGDVGDVLYADSKQGQTAEGSEDGYCIGRLALKGNAGVQLLDVFIEKYNPPAEEA